MVKLDRLIDRKNQTISRLTVLVFFLGTALIVSLFLQYRILQGMVVYYPPDLTKVIKSKVNEIPNHTIFLFTYAILQKLNTWENNGEKDYFKKISQLKHYMTYEFWRKMLKHADAKRDNGELNRVRYFTLYPGRTYSLDRVKKLSGMVWLVTIDALIKEYVNGIVTKQIALRYLVTVTHYDVDYDKNPWKLALAAYSDGWPRQIKYTIGNETSNRENNKQ